MNNAIVGLFAGLLGDRGDDTPPLAFADQWLV